MSPSLYLPKADIVSLSNAKTKKGERAQNARSPDTAELELATAGGGFNRQSTQINGVAKTSYQ